MSGVINHDSLILISNQHCYDEILYNTTEIFGTRFIWVYEIMIALFSNRTNIVMKRLYRYCTSITSVFSVLITHHNKLIVEL